MLTRAELQERVSHYLAMLPKTMTRRQVEEFVRESLCKALVIEPVGRSLITLWWDNDKLHVELPSRLHYHDAIEDITDAVDQAVARVDVNDAVSISPEEFIDRMRRLRGQT